jgi:integrase
VDQFHIQVAVVLTIQRACRDDASHGGSTGARAVTFIDDVFGPHRRFQQLQFHVIMSRRTLQMPRDAAAVLRALKAQQAKDRLRLGNAYSDSGLVFAMESGGPRWPQDVRKQFGRLCQRAGIGAGWHPHETRHTWVSVLSDAGVDIEDIADAAGHINSSVTRNVYRHQIADKLTRAAVAMDAIFGRVSSS